MAKMPTNKHKGILSHIIHTYTHSNTLIFIYGCGYTKFKCIWVNECTHTNEILLVKYLLRKLSIDIITTYILSTLNKQLTVFY